MAGFGSDVGSSPFKDKPDALYSVDQKQLQRQLLSLQYKYTTLQNEFDIVKLSAERETNSLQLKYEKCLNELETALNDTKQLYEENQQLKQDMKAKLKEPSQEHEAAAALRTELFALKQAIRAKDQHIAEVEHRLCSQENDFLSKLESYELESKGNKSLLQKYESQLDGKVHEMKALYQELVYKDNMISELKNREITSAHHNYSTEELQELTVLNNTLKEQLSYTKELENLNLNQATELKKLRQMKDVQQFLKEENASLTSKLSQTFEMRQRLESLEIENIELQEKVTKWGVDRLDGRFKNPEEVIHELSLLQRENIFLSDSNSKLQIDFNQLKLLNDELALERNQLLDLNKNYETTIINLKRINHEVEQQKLLSFEECKLLRQQLDEFEVMDDSANKDQKNASNIIEGYKNQTEDLTNELKRLTEEFSKSDETNGKKRKVTTDLGISYSQALNTLQLKNKDLDKQLALVKNHSKGLELKIATLTELKEKKIRILQLRDNPLLKEQFVRKKQLELLKKENQDLLAKKSETDTIPRSVYECQEFTLKEMEKEIYNCNKKITRLKEVFNKKSLEFIEAVNTLLGFKLEFQSHRKLKLIPCYEPSKSLSIDLQSNTLKSDLDSVIPDWHNLLEEYVLNRGELPLFLSHIMIKLGEKEERILS